MGSARVPRREPPWRVFISHTSELSRYPEGSSYVDAVKSAVTACAHVIVDMGEFAARDQAPAELCESKVAECDVYVGLLGFVYGSPVRERPEVSYTELEYGHATALGLPRLMFLPDEDGTDFGIPMRVVRSDPYGDRQDDFARRVRDAGVTVAHYLGVEDVGRLVERALHDLKERYDEERAPAPTGGEASPGRAAVRFDVPPLARAMAARPAKLDEAVAALVGGPTVPLTSLRGAGGMGKTVLAQQIGHDPRVRSAFPGGIWWLDVGAGPNLDQLADRLYRKCSGGRQATPGVSAVSQVAEVMGDEPSLVLLDDVWAPTDVVEQLLAALPDNVRALVTTRGAVLHGSREVTVEELTVGEARQVLLGERARAVGPDVVRAADEVAGLLGRWALLVGMAGAVARPNLDGPPAAAAAALDDIAADLRADPTVLDDPGSRDRSFVRVVERSEAALGEDGAEGPGDGGDGGGGEVPVDLQRFHDLGAYPPDATLDVRLLADLWGCRVTQAQRSALAIAHVGLATLVPPDADRGLALVVHDMVVDHLHRRHCRPGQFPDLHRRCAAPAIAVDGAPLDVTPARAHWLAYHLIAAAEWPRLEQLASLDWRRALLDATGSDAALFDALDAYAEGALDRLEGTDQARHYFTPVLFAAHVRELIGQVPIAVLAVTARLGNRRAAMVQASHRPDAEDALPAVLKAALADGPAPELVDDAIALAGGLEDEAQRAASLARVAGEAVAAGADIDETVDRVLPLIHAAGGDATGYEATATLVRWLAEGRPDDARTVDRALAILDSFPGPQDRLAGRAVVAGAVAGARPEQARQLWDEVLAGVDALADGEDQAMVLLTVGVASAGADPPRARRVLERVVTYAESIEDENERDGMLAEVVAQLAEAAQGDGEALRAALALAESIENPFRKSEAVVAVAAAVTSGGPGGPGDLDAEALVRSVPRGWLQQGPLNHMARAMVGDAGPDAVERAVTFVRSVVADRAHTLVEADRALAAIVEVVVDHGTDEPTVALARSVADGIPYGRFQGEALAGIALAVAGPDPALAQDLVGRAIEMSGAIGDDYFRDESWTGVATYLAGAAATAAGGTPDLLDTAVGIVASTNLARRDARYGQVAAAVASRAVPDQPLVDRAVELVGRVESSYERGFALSLLASGIASAAADDGPAVQRALGVVTALDDMYTRRGALAEVAASVAATDERAAVELVEQAEPPDGCEEAWARMAVQVAEPGDEPAIDRAMALLEEVTSGQLRAEALAGIARAAARFPRRAAELVERAAESARAVPNEYLRQMAMAAVARELAGVSPEAVPDAADRAVELARDIPDEWDRIAALSAVAAAVGARSPRDPRAVAWAVGLARELPESWRTDEAIVAIGKRMVAAAPGDDAVRASAVDLLLAVPGGTDRNEALTTIALDAVAAAPGDPALAAWARSLADELGDSRWRSAVLGGLAAVAADLRAFDTGVNWRSVDLTDLAAAADAFVTYARPPSLGVEASLAVARTVPTFPSAPTPTPAAEQPG